MPDWWDYAPLTRPNRRRDGIDLDIEVDMEGDPLKQGEFHQE